MESSILIYRFQFRFVGLRSLPETSRESWAIHLRPAWMLAWCGLLSVRNVRHNYAQSAFNRVQTEGSIMSLFGKILGKLGFNTATAGDTATPSQAPAAPTPTASPGPQPVAPSPISTVDVVSQLEGMAASRSEKLNWKTSIVDLLKLLGLDSSLAARKELATELGCPADKMADSAAMNIWLHKTVLQKLAANGGNIPLDLLH